MEHTVKKAERVAERGGDRSLAAWEIVSVTTSFIIAEWVVLPFSGDYKIVGAIPVILAFSLIFVSHRARGETWRGIGFRWDNFFQAARLLLLPMTAAAILILTVAWILGQPRFNREQLLSWTLWLVVWGLMQQYVLQGFINRRAQILWGKGARSVLLVALVFGLLHLPNPWLTVATTAGGLVWAAVYQRAPNLPALGLSHSLMSLLLATTLPASALNSLRVGIKYFG